jgi:hypothetical protein
MESKIHIKIGNLEIDFEGTEDFIKEELLQTITRINEIFKDNKYQISQNSEIGLNLPLNKIDGQKIEGTVNTISAKLNVKSGSDLVLAASAHLDLVDGRQGFSRRDILMDMKTASNYYKETYGSNLSVYLKNLIKSQKLNEISSETYALQARERERLRDLLSSS